MLTITHDEAVKLHMGKMEALKSELSLICNDYAKTWQSGTYRMRKGDIQRAKQYVKEIKAGCNVLNATLKEFEGITR